MDRTRKQEQARAIRVGLVGCGTVGGGFVKVLQQHHDDFMRHQKVDLQLAKVASRTRSKIEALGIDPAIIVDSYEDILADPDIDIVVELVGGTGTAADIVLGALAAGKNVVTANKALLASRSKEIFALAEQNNVEVAFEAAVGGGIPIIDPLRHALIGNEVSSIVGILNGTTNYMLTKMSEEGLAYDAVLADAQQRGYAEADPTADVEGHDAAAKIAILASIAFNTSLRLDDVVCEGISSITPTDLAYARDMGYAIKLLAIAHNTDDGVDIRVHPAMLPTSHPLASVNGVYNAIFVTGDYVGNVMFFGEGAGEGPTASAVMADVIEVARHVANGVPALIYRNSKDKLARKDLGELVTKYYLRFIVDDEPGVLAKISETFGRYDVSIRSMVQHSDDERAELIFMTHEVRERNLQDSLAEIEALPEIEEVASLIRIEEA